MYIFSYCYKLYCQIRKLYQIKKHLDVIYELCTNYYDENSITVEVQLNSLKKLIFDSGSLYIKFFQWYISKLKANIINPNSPESIKLSKFIHYFEDIFEQCPYHSLEHTKQIFHDSMGIELEDYVDINTLKPIASGSIGQVYYAKLKTKNYNYDDFEDLENLDEGNEFEEREREIAIKIKHPDIERDLEDQYELIHLVKMIQSVKFLRNKFNLFFNLDDFLNDVNLQCDFNNEANNCNKFRENFRDSSDYIVFPEVLYQSKDLLISEYIEGSEFKDLTDTQKRQTTLNFVSFMYQMLLVDNFIHGDLHCKNWKVRMNPNKKENNENSNVQMIVYDCGICFENTSTALTSEFWFALVKYDVDGLIKALSKFLDKNKNISDEMFSIEVRALFDKFLYKSLSTSLVMKAILDCFRANDIIICKFLLNFSIFVCVIEEFLKDNDMVDKNKKNGPNDSMYNIINDIEFDLIAFSDVNGCYKGVARMLREHLEDKYEKYKKNMEDNKINDLQSNEKKLFSCISLSGLVMKPPGSD